MNTASLLAAVRNNSSRGLLLVAEQLGSLLQPDDSLIDLAKGLTGVVPTDERSKGLRDALLELLSAADAARSSAARRRPPSLVPKASWKEVLGQLSDGSVLQLTQIADRIGLNKKGSVSNTLDELEGAGLVERVMGQGTAKNARFVRLTEAGLAFVEKHGLRTEKNLSAYLSIFDPKKAAETLPSLAPHGSGSVQWFDKEQGFGFMAFSAHERHAYKSELSLKGLSEPMSVKLRTLVHESRNDPFVAECLEKALTLASLRRARPKAAPQLEAQSGSSLRTPIGELLKKKKPPGI